MGVLLNNLLYFLLFIRVSSSFFSFSVPKRLWNWVQKPCEWDTACRGRGQLRPTKVGVVGEVVWWRGSIDVESKTIDLPDCLACSRSSSLCLRLHVYESVEFRISVLVTSSPDRERFRKLEFFYRFNVGRWDLGWRGPNRLLIW